MEVVVVVAVEGGRGVGCGRLWSLETPGATCGNDDDDDGRCLWLLRSM